MGVGKSKVLTKESKWYFFKPGSHHNKPKEWGLWKRQHSRRFIIHLGESIGTKQKLKFYVRQGGKDIETSWVMHEYYVVGSQCEVGQKMVIMISKTFCCLSIYYYFFWNDFFKLFSSYT